MECLVENLTDNIALLRRRLKTPCLKTEETKIGSTSGTRVCVCFLSDRVDKTAVERIKKKLSEVKIPGVRIEAALAVVSASGYI
jgi:spore germination protein KA